jgi:hypothetical protein
MYNRWKSAEEKVTNVRIFCIAKIRHYFKVKKIQKFTIMSQQNQQNKQQQQ